MRQLTEADIIRLMREEYALKLERAAAPALVSGGKDVEDLISPGLKVLHRGSGIRYTVDSVSPRDVVLRTPEGEKFLIDNDELASEYSLD